MKPYTISVDIDLSRDKVIALFDEPENMRHWQTGFKSFVHISGEAGQPGAKSLIVYQNGKQRIELTETITTRNLPDEFSGTYEWAAGANTLENQFIVINENQTRWTSTCSYEMRSLMMKFMGLVMPGAFKKQNLKFMENFKAFAETGASVAEE